MKTIEKVYNSAILDMYMSFLFSNPASYAPVVLHMLHGCISTESEESLF